MRTKLHSQRKADTRLAVVMIGRHIAYGKDSSPQPAPDPAIGQAAIKQAELGQSWLDLANKQFDIGNQRQQATDDLTNKVVNQQMDLENQSNQWATADRARYLGTFQPLQDQFIDQAKQYGTQAGQEQAASSAAADAQTSAAIQQGTQARSMSAMGINPNSGRFQGTQAVSNMNQALGIAGAKNTARVAAKQQGMAMLGDAVNMGNGLPSTTASYAGLGLNAGNAAVGNNASANQNFFATNGIMGQGYNGAMSGFGSQANILSGLYGQQLNAWSAQQQANATTSAGLGQGLGSLVGSGIGMYAL